MAYSYQLPVWIETKETMTGKRAILARASLVMESKLGKYVVATLDTDLGQISYRLDYGRRLGDGTYQIGKCHRLEYVKH